MTTEECYKAMDGDYETAMSRLHSDALIKKFILKFPAQSGYDKLCKAMEEKDYKEALIAAHTAKGLCLNLNFTRLGESASALTEALRGESFSEENTPLYDRFKEDYTRTVEAINGLD